MSFRRIFAIFIRPFYLIRSNPTRLVSNFLWTFMDILMWGFISKYLGGFATFGVVAVLLGGIILWDFLGRIQNGIMMSFLEDIWSQNFINLFASPLRIKEYLVGLTLVSLVLGVISFAFMVIIAGLAFGYSIFILGFHILLFLSVLTIFGISVGIFVSGLIFRLGPSAEWIAWPIPFLLSIFSGVYYPVSTLPSFLQAVAKVFPASYVFESMRALVLTGSFSPDSAFSLLSAFVLSLVYLLLAYFFFIRIYRHNLKTGSIARFSAET